MYKTVLTLILLSISNYAASGSQSGKVKDIVVRNDGLHWFILDGTRHDMPPCAKFSYWMIEDEKSDYGKSQFSMLLTAYLSNSTISVAGTGTCSRWRDGESVKSIKFSK